MMDYSGVYTSEFAMRRVDPETWGDTGDPIPVAGLSISYSATDSAPLLQTATVDVDEAVSGWYRFYMTATQRESEKAALGTFLFRTTSIDHGHGMSATTAKGDSVLKPVEFVHTLGEYAPAGADGAAFAASILSASTPAPVICDGSFTLAQPVVFEPGTSKLAAVWALLDAGDFCIRLDGDGTIHVTPKPEDGGISITRDNLGMFLTGIEESMEVDQPNRYIAVQDGSVAIAENRDGDNPLSYKTRGYWVEVYDSSAVRVNGETLAAYAQRRLKEESVLVRSVSYKREFMPEEGVFSMVRADLGDYGLVGTGRVASGSMECGHGITVSETAVFKEDIWS